MADSGKPQVSSSEEEKRSKFGTRYLTDPQNVFQHNAWDNVVWEEDQENEAKSVTSKHTENLVPDEKREQYESEADKFWDEFYNQHQNRFFKDRHWLFTEFPELYGVERSEIASECHLSTVDASSSKQNESLSDKDNTSTEKEPVCDGGSSHSSDGMTEGKNSRPFSMLEVGCGVGNTVFPVLNTNNNPNLMVYCSDFSSTAVQIVKEHPDYDTKRCHAFVYDITDLSAEVPVPVNSLDVIIMIFVLSAVNPDKMQSAVKRLSSFLKPGGILLFRDYGRYDMAQLRFKKGRCISENFYVRGDGTRVYFFTQGELKSMFEAAGLEEKENMVDRRLQVNRGRQLKMYRVWIQCKYIKPLDT